MPTIPLFHAFRESQGILTFLTVYLIGGYIKKYSIVESITHKIRNRIIILTIFSLLIAYATYPIGQLISTYPIGDLLRDANINFFDSMVLGMNNIFSLVTGVGIFLIFASCRIKQSKVINFIGRHSFGVYLFHENLIFRNFLWGSFANRELYYDSSAFILHLGAYTIGLFLIGIMMDIILAPLYNKIINSKIINSMCERIDLVFGKALNRL